MRSLVVLSIACLIAGCAQPEAIEPSTTTESTITEARETKSAPASSSATTQSSTSTSQRPASTSSPGSTTTPPPEPPAGPQTSILEGTASYGAELLIHECESGNPAVMIGWAPAELDLVGATKLNMTLEWTPSDPINTELAFSFTDADRSPADGPASALATISGPSPLVWLLEGAVLTSLPDDALLWVVGPSCVGDQQPGAAAMVEQDVDVRGTKALG